MSALGNLFVNLTLNHAEYTSGLTKSEYQAQEFANRSKKHFSEFEKSAQQSIGNVAKSILGIGAGLLSFSAFKSTFDTAVRQLDQVDKIAQKTGSSFGELSRQQQALARAGEDFTAAYSAGLNKLSQNLGKFDADTSRVLKALGVNSTDATGKLRDTGAVARDVAFALQNYEDGAGKAAAVTALFGKSGVELIPVLNDLAEQYQHVTGVSDNFAESTRQFNDLMDIAASQSTFLGQSMAVGLLPSLNSIGEGFKKVGFDAGNFGQIIGEGLGRVLRVTAATVTGFVAVVSGAGAAVKALLSGDFGNVGNAFSAASGKYDGMIKSFLSGGSVIEQATVKIEKQKLSLDGLMLKTDGANQSVKRMAASQKEQISDADRFINSLNREVETLNKSTFEVKKLEAAKLGLSKVADPLIDKIQRETEAHKRQADAMQKGISITQQVRTSEEQFRDTQRELNELLKGGAITQETYNRALSKASEELKKVENKAAESFPRMEEFAIQASRNIQNSFSNMIRLGLEGDFKGMVTSFKSALFAMVAEAAALDLAGAIFGKSNNNGGSFLANMLGLSGSGGLSSGGKVAGGLLGMLGLAGGSSTAMAFTGQSFLGGAGTALGGTGLSVSGGLASLSSIGGTLAGAGIGIGTGSMIGGDKKVAGLGSGFTSTGGALLGGAVGGPLGAVIGGVVGGAISALFGRGPLKQKETNLIGEFGLSGFDGTTSTKFKAQGGLIVGDKVVRIVADTQTGEVISGASGKLQAAATEAGKLAQQVGRFIEGQWLPIVDGFKQISEKMGIAKDAMKDFNFQINIASEKGKALTQEQIGEKIGEAADNLARKLMPGIDDLRKGSESAAQAFDRLGVEFDDLVKLAVARGMDLAGARSLVQNASSQDRSSLFDQLGVKDLGSKLDGFINSFASPEEQQRILTDTIKTLIKPFGIGLGAVDTKREFFEIFKALDLSTEAGREAQRVMLDNAQTFNAWIESQQVQQALEIESRKLNIEASNDLKSATEKLTQNIEDQRQQAKTTLEAGLMGGRFDVNSALASKQPSDKLSNFLGKSFKYGEFSAESFNFAFAEAVAQAAKDAMVFVSENALKISNVDRLVGELSRTFSTESLLTPIINELVQGGASRDAATFLGKESLRKRFQSRAPGVASVLAAEDDLKLAASSGVVGKREQFGADVIAYGKAIDELNKDLNLGKVSVDSYNKSVDFLNKQFGSDTARLLNNTAEQLERIASANRRLGSAGLSSIQFYFKQITDSVQELGAGLSEPAQQVSSAVGRLNSLAFVLSKSAAAAVSGFANGGRKDVADQISQAGGQASIANLIAKAAGVAGGALNTQQGQLLKAKLDQDSSFKGTNTKQLSLLIEGVKAFDTTSFEKAFNNINAALIKKDINESQFTKLFNTSLDVFEGLSSAAGSSAAALSDLRKAARDVADELLDNQSKNIFSPTQSFQVAEQQFNDVIARAKAGDATASNQLGPAANALLAAGQNSLADQTSLIGYVQANLRSVGGVGATDRLTIAPEIQAQIDAQTKRLDEQNKTNQAILLALDDMRSTYRKWDTQGLLTV